MSEYPFVLLLFHKDARSIDPIAKRYGGTLIEVQRGYRNYQGVKVRAWLPEEFWKWNPVRVEVHTGLLVPPAARVGHGPLLEISDAYNTLKARAECQDDLLVLVFEPGNLGGSLRKLAQVAGKLLERLQKYPFRAPVERGAAALGQIVRTLADRLELRSEVDPYALEDAARVLQQVNEDVTLLQAIFANVRDFDQFINDLERFKALAKRAQALAEVLGNE